jgi:hypothetical protein
MPTTIFLGSAFHSVAQNGTGLFAEGPFSTWIGNLVIDLAGAPLPAGHYKVEAEVVIAGNIEIYLPRDARYSLTGSTILGNRKVREGLDYGKQLRRRWAQFFGRSSQVPALPETASLVRSDGAVSFDLDASTLVGEVKVYRL